MHKITIDFDEISVTDNFVIEIFILWRGLAIHFWRYPLLDTISSIAQSGPCTAPVCPSGRSISGTGCIKQWIPAHVFKPGSILHSHARNRILRAGKCTLMDAFGRRNSRGLGGSTVKRKGRAGLGIDHSGPGPHETCSSTNAIHSRKLSFIGGVKTSI